MNTQKSTESMRNLTADELAFVSGGIFAAIPSGVVAEMNAVANSDGICDYNYHYQRTYCYSDVTGPDGMFWLDEL